MTEKLFDRTATFFYMRENKEIDLNSEKHKKRAKLLSDILKLTLEIPQPSTDCVLALMKKIRANLTDSGDILFEKHVETMVKTLGDVPLDDIQSVVETYSIINLLLRKSEFEKDFKECLNIS